MFFVSVLATDSYSQLADLFSQGAYPSFTFSSVFKEKHFNCIIFITFENFFFEAQIGD